jgi:hypothetical protein
MRNPILGITGQSLNLLPPTAVDYLVVAGGGGGGGSASGSFLGAGGGGAGGFRTATGY